MKSAAQFRLLGFPVHIRLGFVLFMALVIFVSPGPLGWWLAAWLFVLTLVHELGHALAARATGAKAEIALDMLFGYASFRPTRELRWWERAGVSLAGPLSQLALSVGLLLALGVNPFDVHSADRSAMTFALWWAGPVIALYNLAPVVPLDGGHVVEAVLSRFVGGRRATRIMLYTSIVLTAGAAIYAATNPRFQRLAVFIALPLMSQLQMIGELRRRDQLDARLAHRQRLELAEQQAWLRGSTDGFNGTGGRPSPWFLASLQVRAGRPDQAVRLLTTALTTDEEISWANPAASAPPAELAALVDLLPRPLPAGNPAGELALVGVLHRLGRFRELAEFAAQCYARLPGPEYALLVAQAAAGAGDPATAAGWLRLALRGDDDGHFRALAARMPELRRFGPDSELARLLNA